MGCCQSSLSPIERLTFEYILANIPLHCQQEIIRLPPRKFLSVYQKHLDAEEHLQREEYLAAITSASQAIEELKILLHHHKDHFIFADIHKLLSICYWKMGNIERAFLDGLIALALRLAHMPTDYTQISLQLYRLALIYLVVDKWKEAEDFLIQAITIGRLSTELPQTYIQELEASLAYLR
jgi:tetratricopeptide (TPR) repeat protein